MVKPKVLAPVLAELLAASDFATESAAVGVAAAV